MEIDVYKGNESIFLILTGIGGSTKGYQNKYVTIAQDINKRYGWTVFVVATESGVWNDEKKYFDRLMKEVGDYLRLLKTTAKTVYAMGTSAGANLLLHNAHRYSIIERILPINPLINVNYNLFCKFEKAYKGETTIIVGEKDSSFLYLKMLKRFESDRFNVVVVKNADHNFTNMLKDYIELSNNHLFNVLH